MNKQLLLSGLGIGFLSVFACASEMTHAEKGLIGSAGETRSKSLSSFCLDRNDNIIACDEAENCLRQISPADKLLAKWPLDFAPQVVTCRTDGSLVVAGAGHVALLDAAGKTLVTGSLPVPPMRVNMGEKQSKEQIAQRIRMMSAASSVGAMGDDIFVCAKANTGFTVYRLNDKLEGATPIIKGLNGCCGQMDFTAKGDAIYLAANCESKVVKYDRDGKRTGDFGKDKANADSYFNGCCEPKNVCFGPDGSLYVAESAQCCVNRFSVDGKFLDHVAVVKGVIGCVRVTVAVNRDASIVYMLGTDKNVIHVLARKASPKA